MECKARLFPTTKCLTPSSSTSTPLAQGGTVQKNAFQYRAAARKGKWSVSRIYTQTDSDEKSVRHLGYIVHHEAVSPDDCLRRVSKVGISNGNRHADQQIVYVGRYDWVRDLLHHYF